MLTTQFCRKCYQIANEKKRKQQNPKKRDNISKLFWITVHFNKFLKKYGTQNNDHPTAFIYTYQKTGGN